ncbi:zinc finger E-box-binding homeobox 2-like isoform X1 [Mercenaria mercenaria]|uniref:zinc finger E-box-binding homeobox 2-like isoform X1 n=1 Tax=Mercenaria mercenaria TaxID=6596 RepID=UPI00234F187A|nr:zinc finger E-box-binding homeobox 2-like isoform X1 [Mercenaria mercenaria]
MGTVSEEPKQGHIYLQNDVSGEFDKVLATSKHSSVDTFLEHLMDLYTKASKSTQCVVVRTEVAQRYTALLCETRFQTSDDLMKHLLNLHVEYLKTASNNNTKETRERSVPRKSRKSQPKRNIKHTALLDSEDSGDHLTGSVTEDPWREVSVSSVEESETETSEVDLSRVKQEVIDVDDTNVKNSDKDEVRDAGPVCLTLRKPTWARESQIEVVEQYQHSIEEYNPKSTRQFTQPNWRSRSEPVGRQNAVAHVKQELVPLQVIPCADNSNSFEVAVRESMEPADEKLYDNSSLVDDDRLGYNYVLNSLASSPGPEGQRSNSLPSSPVQVPVNYLKSNPYTISSDEEEAEDLTISTPDQPHNLSTLKPQIQYAGSKGQDTLVKYDSNANAVPVTQFPNGQFISQTPVAIPQNLIFHDQQSSNNLVGQPQVLHFAQSNQGSAAQMVTNSGKELSRGNPPPLLVTGMPPLQLVNIRGPPPLTSPILIRPGLPAPNTTFKFHNTTPQMLAAANAVVSPPNNASQQRDVTSPVSAGQSSDGTSPQQLKRKRKRLEDTTVFRDPQEASLPFNGPNKYRFYCDVCDTGFTRKYTFNRHKCKGRVEKHYCQLCDKAYLSKYKLKDHILVKHEGQTVSCPECGKRFSSRSSMEMHKKQQHEGQYSIFCKVCGKGFNHTGHYYGHMNKHTNTKPFWCQQCGKRFYGSSYLHNHKQVCRGNNDLNYSCSICERKFKCELYLKKHMKIHDNTPIISNPNVTKVKDEDLAKAGVKVADPTTVNGAVFPETGQPVFPNIPDVSDSNSNSNSGALLIDEESQMEIDSFNNETAAIGAKQAVVA